MVITLDNQMPAGDEGNSVLTIYGVVFTSWQLGASVNDFVLEDMIYKARRVSIVDTEVPA
jgi:hypothetical protein